jgi:DNA-binding transcriptional LysR family regulator
MDVYQLEVFASVYRNRGFSRASKELNITQPSVSAHIKKLEEELGVRLFDRVGRKTIPTKEGELLSQKAEEIIQKLKDIKTDISGHDEKPRGLIGIGASSVPGTYIVPQAASEFKKRFPDVSFSITIGDSGEITRRVLENEIILGVVDEPDKRGRVKCLHEIEDELVLVSAPGFIKKKTITPLGLLTIPLIIRDEGSDSRKSMEKQHLLHRISIKALNVAATVGSTEALKEGVKAGLGAAIISRFAVKDDLGAGLVKEAAIKGVRMKRSFYVIAHKKRSMPESYGSFVDFMISTTKKAFSKT